MPRPRRDVPWFDIRDNGVYYAFWYNATKGRTDKATLDTRDPVEAGKRFAQWLLSGGTSRSGDDAGLSVPELLAYYEEHYVDAGKCEAPERQKAAIAMLRTYFTKDHAKDVTAVMTEAYAGARLKGEVRPPRKKRGRKSYLGSNSTIRRELNVLVAASNFAILRERMPLSHAPRVVLPSEDRGDEVKWLTKEQLQKVLAAAEGDLKDFIQLAYYTAARRASIEQLMVSQVDLKHGRIRLNPEGAAATKKRRPIVPLYAEIRPTIERRIEGSVFGMLFGASTDFYRPFIRLCAGLGIDAHPHMLRHSRATHMLMDGEDIYKVAKLLGDTVATVERVYGHFCTEYLATKSNVEVA